MAGVRREFDANPAAEAGPHDVNLFESQRVEKVEIEERKIAHVIDILGNVRPAKTGMIGRDDVELLREQIECGLIIGVAHDAVKEKDRRTSAGSADAHFAAAHIHNGVLCQSFAPKFSRAERFRYSFQTCQSGEPRAHSHAQITSFRRGIRRQLRRRAFMDDNALAHNENDVSVS